MLFRSQYYLNFTIFFTQKKKFLKNGSGSGSGRVMGQPVFASGQKIGFGLGIFRVGSGQKILTRFAMSNNLAFELCRSRVNY